MNKNGNKMKKKENESMNKWKQGKNEGRENEGNE